MPYYTHKCDSCGIQIMVRRKMEDRNLSAVCPECHGTTQLIPSDCSIEFKGKGWAKDGYKG
jgi:putative FmdB family regulatory protein